MTMYLGRRGYSGGKTYVLGSGNVTARVDLKKRTMERLWISTRLAHAVMKRLVFFFTLFIYFEFSHTWAAPPMAFIFVKS